MMEREDHEYHKKNFTIIGKILYFSYAFGFYTDGDGLQMYGRWWHPLAWIFVPHAFIIYAIIDGFPAAWRNKHEVGIGIKPWFKERPEDFKRWFWNT
jgi:hypothetical protein